MKRSEDINAKADRLRAESLQRIQRAEQMLLALRLVIDGAKKVSALANSERANLTAARRKKQGR